MKATGGRTGKPCCVCGVRCWTVYDGVTVHAKCRTQLPSGLASALAHVEAHGALPELLRGIGGAS